MVGKDKKRRALLVIDMLNDFIREGAPLRVPGGEKIVKNIQRKLREARRKGIPIIYLCDQHPRRDPEFRVWPPHAVKGTEGAEVVKELKPQEGDWVIPKTTYSGFFGTKLQKTLRGLKVTELIITGVCTEICVLYTAADAYMHGFQVEVPEGCVAGLTEKDHRFALRQIREILKPKQI